MDVVIDPTAVRDPSLLECDISGPPPATKLLIYTGIAVVPPFGLTHSDTFSFSQATATLDLEARHLGRKFDPRTTNARASAVGLAGITGSEEAENFTWAVDKTATRIEPDGTLLLIVDLAKQGALDVPNFVRVTQLYFISYQVNVRTAF
jgi:hypothetical protein